MLDPFYIVGPTGSGKSAVALELASRIDGEIINADAFQVYREFPILTAAPKDAEFKLRPHHLYRCISVSETFSVARYHELALRTLDDVQARGKRPLIVGGSGLYLKALTHGINETPPSSSALRTQLSQLSPDLAVHWLKALDPEGAALMNLKNPRYVQRAIEISLLTGQPASALKTSWQTSPSPTVRGVVLQWDREILYKRINQRVLDMFDHGVVSEIAALSELSSTAAKAIGVAEIRRYLKGETTIADATDAIQQATRRYAKRQGTWFRRESHFIPLPLAPADSAASIVNRILEAFNSLR